MTCLFMLQTTVVGQKTALNAVKSTFTGTDWRWTRGCVYHSCTATPAPHDEYMVIAIQRMKGEDMTVYVF